MSKNSQITRQEIEKTAKLARLELSEEQIEKFSAQISQVLEAFQGLEEAQATDVEDFNHYLLLDDFKNQFRQDQVIEEPETNKEQIRDLFPQKGGKEDRYLKVKKVF